MYVIFITCNRRIHTYTHTHPFNSPLSRTSLVSRYHKGRTNLEFTEARDFGWQWHQLGHMQVCTSLQTDNHASTPPIKLFAGRMPFVPPIQQCQSTEDNRCDRRMSNNKQKSTIRIQYKAERNLFHLTKLYKQRIRKDLLGI